MYEVVVITIHCGHNRVGVNHIWYLSFGGYLYFPKVKYFYLYISNTVFFLSLSSETSIKEKLITAGPAQRTEVTGG